MTRDMFPGAGRRRAGWRAGFALVLCLVALEANALRKVDPGKEPRLAVDEGLLVISVDSDTAVSSLRFRKVGSSWS